MADFRYKSLSLSLKSGKIDNIDLTQQLTLQFFNDFSLRSWRYCVIKVLAAEPRSKKRSWDESWRLHSRPQSPSFLRHVVGYKLSRVALGTRLPPP